MYPVFFLFLYLVCLLKFFLMHDSINYTVKSYEYLVKTGRAVEDVFRGEAERGRKIKVRGEAGRGVKNLPRFGLWAITSFRGYSK